MPLAEGGTSSNRGRGAGASAAAMAKGRVLARDIPALKSFESPNPPAVARNLLREYE
jgi:hypothetical protein